MSIHEFKMGDGTVAFVVAQSIKNGRYELPFVTSATMAVPASMLGEYRHALSNAIALARKWKGRAGRIAKK